MALVLVMVAGMLPFGGLFASAAEAPVYAEDTVALVNGVEVSAENILMTIACCTSGGTIEVVKDFTCFAIALQDYEGKTNKWVINGNGYTISSPFTTLSNDSFLITCSATYVEINDLKVKTMGSGIKVTSGAQVTLNDVEIYSGGTKEGKTVATAEREYYTATSGTVQLNSKCILISASTRSNITINGGVYKAYGVGGIVLDISRGNLVVNSGDFIGEDCNFVARVYNGSRMTDLSVITASLTVYGGNFIKPVTDKKALQKNADTGAINGCSTGAVIRGDAGGLVNIHGGTFANFAGKATDENGTTILTDSNREWVILSGTSAGNNKSDIGFVNIFGGDFYSFMTDDVTKDGPQVIGNQSVDLTTSSETERVKINASIWGGNFYSTNATREENITRMANKEVPTLQHVAADQYSASSTSNNTVTVYGKEFTGVTKWAFSYIEPSSAPTGATVKVKNSTGKTYYLSDYSFSGTVSGTTVAVSMPAIALALNGVADNGATVTLLDNITIVPTEVLNRAQKLTLDGNGKIITSATSGLTVSSGDITIKNLTINASTATPTEGSAPAYALRIAKTAITEDNVTVDSFKLKLVLENCAFNARLAVEDNPFFEGSVSATGCTANGAALTLAHTYTVPAPVAPDMSLFDDEEEDEDDNTTGEGDNGTTEAPTDTPVTEEPEPAADEKGCGGAIGVGALAVLAVAGLACGIVSKKRED